MTRASNAEAQQPNAACRFIMRRTAAPEVYDRLGMKVCAAFKSTVNHHDFVSRRTSIPVIQG